jgi:hypothetical protein
MLHEAEGSLFRDAIQSTAEALSIREVYVEKDYWVTLLLKRLSVQPFKNDIVFKGGTSLSKAYKICDRFSEDVDLAVVNRSRTDNQLKEFIRKVEKTLAASPFEALADPAVSKGSRFRKTVHRYPRITGAGDFGQATDKLVLEINSFADPDPAGDREVCSYIGEHLTKVASASVSEYELSPFSVCVLSWTRTFAEKILAVVRASYSGADQLGVKIRHLYDLTKLMEQGEIQAHLGGEGFFVMLRRVQQADSQHPEFAGEWSKKPLAQAPIFMDPTESLKPQSALYRGAFKELVHGPLPELEYVAIQMRQIAQRLKDFDEIKKI